MAVPQLPPPSFVQVGPFRYAISWEAARIAERRYQSENSSACASTFFRDLRIIIDPEAPPGRQRAYLLHEIIHACWELAGVPMEKPEDDEAVIGPIAPLLLDVLQRNPAVVAYLTNPGASDAVNVEPTISMQERLLVPDSPLTPFDVLELARAHVCPPSCQLTQEFQIEWLAYLVRHNDGKRIHEMRCEEMRPDVLTAWLKGLHQCPLSQKLRSA